MNTDFTATVIECSLQAPTDGFVIAIASGSMTLADDAYEVQARLSVDGAGGDASDRWVNVYTNTGDGTDKTIALTQYRPVAAGTRRIAFTARRYLGGTVRIFDATLTAIFVPASAAQTVCGSADGQSFHTQSNVASVVTSCQISVAEDSVAFAFASASLGYAFAPVEARVRLALDGAAMPASDRWVDVYSDGGDGNDESIATQYGFMATPGTHTV